jgi:hypothetical protein
MHAVEREQRLATASGLLHALKQSGCSQRFVAAYLRVSHGALSHWKAAREDKTRRVGVPTDEQLTRLVGLLRYQLKQNLDIALTCIEEDLGRRRERILLLQSLGPVLEQSEAARRGMLQRWAHLAEHAREFIEKVGWEDARTLLWPASIHQLGLGPPPNESDWEEAHAKANLEAANVQAAMNVTEEDVERTRRDLDEWVQAQRDRLRARMKEKPRHQEREKTDTEPD